MIGGWIVPKESSDFRRAPVREVYRADGTYSLFFFDTPACGKVVRQVDANWHVERGVIVATVIYVSTSQFGKAGDVSTDQIITMDGTNMTLHSLHDGVFGWSLGNSMFSRRKAEGCYDPTAKY